MRRHQDKSSRKSGRLLVRLSPASDWRARSATATTATLLLHLLALWYVREASRFPPPSTRDAIEIVFLPPDPVHKAIVERVLLVPPPYSLQNGGSASVISRPLRVDSGALQAEETAAAVATTPIGEDADTEVEAETISTPRIALYRTDGSINADVESLEKSLSTMPSYIPYVREVPPWEQRRRRSLTSHRRWTN